MTPAGLDGPFRYMSEEKNFPTRRTKDSHNRSNLVSYGRELKTITCSRTLSREAKMDVNFTSLPSLQSQSTSQSGTGSVSGGDSAVKTLQSNPDAVVVQSIVWPAER